VAGYLKTSGSLKWINMQLNRQNISKIKKQPGLVIPEEKLFELPEKVLQFGTGVLLRGLPDYFIDKANREGIFNGRIVIVKSTSNGGTDEFSKQDGLYTISVRGVENGKTSDEMIINSSISRVISAIDNWQSILDCAADPEIGIIISNTTEVGITLVEDDIRLSPPVSFPGKLLAFLYHRYKIFNGSEESGMVIIPTELIPGNADKLQTILVQLAKMNKLEDDFITWLQYSNDYCNSLVDRIVPGKFGEKERTIIDKKSGYSDDLMIMAETFRLWAIETKNEKIKEKLSFAQADEGIILAPDIEKFRELKLRLLNGTHTFSCALAILSGFKTVREAMDNEDFASFVHNLSIHEIAATISGGTISYDEAVVFAKSVMDRFSNPFIEHQWISISVQYTSKMRLRNIPLLLKYFSKNIQPPELMTLGFAAYLLFMKTIKNSKGEFEGEANGTKYVIQDDKAGMLSAKWEDSTPSRFVEIVLGDVELWGSDLCQLSGFSDTLKTKLATLIEQGAVSALQHELLNKTVAG
jgi:tagaturonate reductase